LAIAVIASLLRPQRKPVPTPVPAMLPQHPYEKEVMG
jgi:hypothetical protein